MTVSRNWSRFLVAMPWRRGKQLGPVLAGDEIAHDVPIVDAPSIPRISSRLGEGALTQDQSPFFSKLPGEIRTQIYSEMWRTGGYTGGVHIELRDLNQSGPWLRSYPCSVDPYCATRRNEMLDRLWQNQQWEVQHGTRQKSDIMMADGAFPKLHAVQHWECYEPKRVERLTGRKIKRWSPFIPVLLTCKRFYLESIGNLYQTVDFHFYNNPRTTAFRFLIFISPQRPMKNVRSIHLNLVKWNGRDSSGNYFPHSACDTEVLQELHIWLEGLPEGGHTVTQRDILAFVGPKLAPKVTLHVPEPPSEFCRACYEGGSYEVYEGPMNVVQYERPKYRFRVFSKGGSEQAQTYGYAPLKLRDTCSLCVQHPRRF